MAEENGLQNIRKVFIVIVQKDFLKNNIVNMGEQEKWENKIINNIYFLKILLKQLIISLLFGNMKVENILLEI